MEQDHIENKTPAKLSARDHFMARMTMPIGTSTVGIPITDAIRKDIERYSREIDERIKNGLY